MGLVQKVHSCHHNAILCTHWPHANQMHSQKWACILKQLLNYNRIILLEVQRQHIRSALGLQGLIVVSRMMLSLIFCAKSLSTPNWAQSRLFSLSIDYMTSWWYSERHTILTEFGLYDWRGSLVDSRETKQIKHCQTDLDPQQTFRSPQFTRFVFLQSNTKNDKLILSTLYFIHQYCQVYNIFLFLS